MASGFSHHICWRTVFFLVFATWLALGVPTFADENLHRHEARLRERMLQRAEAYLNFVDQTDAPKIAPYVAVVRGLLHAGFSADHPFLRSKSDLLLRIVPRDQSEAAGQREIALLCSWGNRAGISPSEQEISTIRAAAVSDDFNEKYRRFGVVRLPRGFDPDNPRELPFPEHETEHFQIAVSHSSSSFRLSQVGDLPESSIGSDSDSNDRRCVETDRQPSFVLIAKTIRLRI